MKKSIFISGLDPDTQYYLHPMFRHLLMVHIGPTKNKITITKKVPVIDDNPIVQSVSDSNVYTWEKHPVFTDNNHLLFNVWSLIDAQPMGTASITKNFKTS